MLKAIKPVFKKLSDDGLLQKYTNGGTQNAYESVHNNIWIQCPMIVFVCRARLDIAASDTVSVFKEGEMGRLRVFDLLGGPNLLKMIQSGDKKRLTV